jgi:hypothetical protein
LDGRLDELESTVRSEGGDSVAKKFCAIGSELLPQADFQPTRFFLTELNAGTRHFRIAR